MADRETGFFRGEGGTVWEMDLPLPEVMQEKITKGYVVRVANADGDPYEPPAPQAPDNPLAGGSDLTDGVSPQPARTAPKAEWVGYAVRVHDMRPDDAEAMTKQDLIDKFGG